MSKTKSFSEFLAVFVIIFAQVCSALDFRNSDTPDLAYFRNYTSIKQPHSLLDVSTLGSVTKPRTLNSTGKKWQVGRVSRKQYEIINMLWRKTNVFGDEETTLPNFSSTDKLNTQASVFVEPQAQHEWAVTPLPQKISLRPIPEMVPKTQSSTLSYIEFYYLDEIEATKLKPEIKYKENINPDKNKRSKPSGRIGQLKNFVSRSPLFAFRINGPSYKRMRSEALYVTTTTDQLPKREMNLPEITMKVTTNNNFLQRFLTRNLYGNWSPRYVLPYITNTTPTTSTSSSTSATPSDRVKFFELYDNNTRKPKTENIDTNLNIENKISEEKRKALEQVDNYVGHGPNKIRYAKKHIKGGDLEQKCKYIEKGFVKINKHVETTVNSKDIRTVPDTAVTGTWDDFYNFTVNEAISHVWSKYPFAAVYVYDRYQVHCDAAAISSYWLISTAACLSRHREEPGAEERSAFVSYCGANWWNPERIAYVKYALVHPKYNPKDTVRKHLYNIGVIQVASSMASSCPGWAPVNIISHQYATEPRGSLGTAVGWGLNRYDTSYASRDLPRNFLSTYESFIYSDRCPGNSGYRNTKRLSEQAVSNVYCMSLPPYAGENNDPVHGGLLLVGGKLIALYLQEERRRLGDQSAQYTGVWRLVPWVLDIAKDPEEMDFSFVR